MKKGECEGRKGLVERSLWGQAVCERGRDAEEGARRREQRRPLFGEEVWRGGRGKDLDRQRPKPVKWGRQREKEEGRSARNRDAGKIDTRKLPKLPKYGLTDQKSKPFRPRKSIQMIDFSKFRKPPVTSEESSKILLKRLRETLECFGNLNFIIGDN